MAFAVDCHVKSSCYYFPDPPGRLKAKLSMQTLWAHLETGRAIGSLTFADDIVDLIRLFVADNNGWSPNGVLRKSLDGLT